MTWEEKEKKLHLQGSLKSIKYGTNHRMAYTGRTFSSAAFPSAVLTQRGATAEEKDSFS